MTRMVGLYMLLIIGLLLTTRSTCQSDCKDLDTDACRLMTQSRPNLCSDPSLSSLACPRFCNQCPLMCYDCPVPLRDPKLCNTTSTCAANETCLLKELKSFDGHHEYLMSCASREVCEGGGLGFVFGKRDVSLSCCTTDYCNNPLLTSTTASTSLTTVSATKPAGNACTKDVVFLVDDSNRMGSSNFQMVKQFIHDLTQHFPIDSSNTQVAMVEFDIDARVAWYLNTYRSKSDILRAISNLNYHGFGADLISGLDLVRHDVLNPNHHSSVNSVGDRPNVPNVLVVLTERSAFDGDQTIVRESSMLHQIANVIVINVGRPPNGIDSDLASRLPSDPQQMLWVDTIDNLASQIPKLLTLICG